MVEKTKPKLLFWDIETSYSLLAGFGLRDQNFSHKQIVQEWFIICVSWMFEGDKKVSAITSIDGDDRNVIEKMYEILGEADILVHHNGDKFDLKKLRARAMVHRMPPLAPITTIDTLKVSRRLYGFMSHRLGYIAQLLGLSQKGNPSEGLWMRILQGDKKALKEMVLYNKQDVLVLRDVYNIFKPHIENHPSLGALIHGQDRGTCRNCGGVHLIISKYKLTKSGKQVQYQCKDCGAYKQSSVKSLEVLNDGH
jgi:uncharacterized protein YprB with RNaseH-like and TPR domain